MAGKALRTRISLVEQRSLTVFIDNILMLVKEIEGSLGRVSFTSDIWSDPQLASFLAMTAH
jgi:hypothetical protein